MSDIDGKAPRAAATGVLGSDGVPKQEFQCRRQSDPNFGFFPEIFL
jgi:hypothetical protein